MTRPPVPGDAGRAQSGERTIDANVRAAEFLLDLLRTRRSVRRFRPEAPPRAAIERLIEAAVMAPSASNAQPWRFLAVTDRSVVARLAAAVRAAVERIGGHVEPACAAQFRSYGDYFTRFETAPVVIAALFRRMTLLSNLVDDGLAADDRERIAALEASSGLIGTSLALANLLLMAHALGLGASGMTGPLVAADRIRVVLEVPASWDVAALVPVGYPAESPPATDRRPADKVLRWI